MTLEKRRKIQFLFNLFFCVSIFTIIFFFTNFLGDFLFFSYYIQHCFICRPSDSTVPRDAGIEPRTVATGALTVRRSNHYRLHLIRNQARSHPHQARSHPHQARSHPHQARSHPRQARSHLTRVQQVEEQSFVLHQLVL